MLLWVLILSTQSARDFRRLMVLLIRSNLHLQIARRLLVRRLQCLADLLVADAGFAAACVTPVALFGDVVLVSLMHLLVCQLALSHDHWRLALLIHGRHAMLLSIDLEVTHLTVRIVRVRIEIELGGLVLGVDFGRVL